VRRALLYAEPSFRGYQLGSQAIPAKIHSIDLFFSLSESGNSSKSEISSKISFRVCLLLEKKRLQKCHHYHSSIVISREILF
jgi:hypothetical protein